MDLRYNERGLQQMPTNTHCMGSYFSTNSNKTLQDQDTKLVKHRCKVSGTKYFYINCKMWIFLFFQLQQWVSAFHFSKIKSTYSRGLALPTCHVGCLSQGGAALLKLSWAAGRWLTLRHQTESLPALRKPGKRPDCVWPTEVSIAKWAEVLINNVVTWTFEALSTQEILLKYTSVVTYIEIIKLLATSHHSFQIMLPLN